MGNQLVGIAPSQIFPVEHYLTDFPEVQYDASLGSTRFFKVVRAKSKEGYIVVKVFAIHDPSLPLKTYKERLEDIGAKLAPAVNCLCYRKALLTDKAGLIIREYVKHNVYDRISTRPFLSTVEKKWIAFQVLYALSQCHRLGVCHGDIKLENVMVTSWNWVLLTDFAPFKPTYLPEDNPADFSFFFDTSRRRTCYIAPERFIRTLESHSEATETEAEVILPEEGIKRGDLTPAMDIFSAGCALTELFTEGHPPFDFSQLLAYRSGEYTPTKVLERIDDPEIREFLGHMMQRDANVRLSAEDYLAQQKGRVFPEYFYTFFQSYMTMFSASPIMSPDEKISRLRKDIKNVVQMFGPPKEEGEEKENGGGETGTKGQPEGLLLFSTLVTSCVRALHHCGSKLACLEVMQELAQHLPSDIILDRILPYVFHLMSDRLPRVRVTAIHTLTRCLSCVKTVPLSDANIFPEYILPSLQHITHDESVSVRAAFTQDVALLAETALRFLQLTQLAYTAMPNDTPQPTYESELHILQEMFEVIVCSMLTDSDNIVRRVLMEYGITRLCVFFGRQKANDVLLSHMITFLNDKGDKDLRGSFFNCIVGVATYVGWQSSSILKPLLQQGLSDPEEFVMCKSINAMATLTELGLLQKLALYELLSETAPFLVHPSVWVRQAMAGFVSAAARTLNLVDVQCKVLGLVRPYLERPVIQADKEVILLSALRPPLPRTVYDSVLKCADPAAFLQALEDVRRARTRGVPPEIPPGLRNLFRRLASEGMNETAEEYLLAMREHLVKTHRHRAVAVERSQDGLVDLSIVPLRGRDLVPPTAADPAPVPRRAAPPHSPTMNAEWQHMFGSAGSNPGTVEESPDEFPVEPTAVVPAQTFVQKRCPPCKAELQTLLQKKGEEYAMAVLARREADRAGSGSRDTQKAPQGWCPKGQLVAHLHEHRGSITRLAVVPGTPVFASSSSDGSVRLWDCGRMEGRNIANRSRHVYNRVGGPITSLAVCHNHQSLAAAADNGSIHVFRMESHSSKVSFLYSRQLDMCEEGCAVDMNYYDSGSQSVLVYATAYGYLVGWDLRSPFNAWKLESNLRHGMVTSFCTDARQHWLAVGTSGGAHVCWDLRFQLPISTVIHPRNARVRRLARHPVASQPWVASSVQGNNEVSVWDMETQCRQTALWASPSPALSQQQPSPHSVCAMTFGMGGDQTPFVITGGTDMRLRFWDMGSPNGCYVMAPAANDPPAIPGTAMYKYQTRLIDGTEVIQEIYTKPRPNYTSRGGPAGGEESPRPELPAAGHHDCISDIALCQASQLFVVSASRDGVIKVWK